MDSKTVDFWCSRAFSGKRVGGTERRSSCAEVTVQSASGWTDRHGNDNFLNRIILIDVREESFSDKAFLDFGFWISDNDLVRGS